MALQQTLVAEDQGVRGLHRAELVSALTARTARYGGLYACFLTKLRQHRTAAGNSAAAREIFMHRWTSSSSGCSPAGNDWQDRLSGNFTNIVPTYQIDDSHFLNVLTAIRS